MHVEGKVILGNASPGEIGDGGELLALWGRGRVEGNRKGSPTGAHKRETKHLGTWSQL